MIYCSPRPKVSFLSGCVWCVWIWRDHNFVAGKDAVCVMWNSLWVREGKSLIIISCNLQAEVNLWRWVLKKLYCTLPQHSWCQRNPLGHGSHHLSLHWDKCAVNNEEIFMPFNAFLSLKYQLMEFRDWEIWLQVWLKHGTRSWQHCSSKEWPGRPWRGQPRPGA